MDPEEEEAIYQEAFRRFGITDPADQQRVRDVIEGAKQAQPMTVEEYRRSRLCPCFSNFALALARSVKAAEEFERLITEAGKDA